jgi:hypothetical protein
MLLRGFRTNMQLRADTSAIRAWLETVDPNDYGSEGEDPFVEQIRIAASDWPEPIAALGPRGVFFFLDDRGHPAVRLSWGSGFLGHCGLVVGHKEMRVPRADPLAVNAHNLELGRGAYVWCML